ncbi:MAG: ABC transporter, cobalt/nickel transport system ATP-binding protein [Armatimonadetes bacterium CSP1-3]|nr:MAG: ABC transporter, cobalt/nickel transport system ATP-binding protein [Armatimonadetes bacterium CSP1-3]
MIEVRDVHHVYLRDSPLAAVALRGISLTIPDGERIGLIGPTGSGKSTLVQTLNALIRPTSGTVSVDGEDIFAPKADRRRVRQKVALLFQYAEQQLFEETVAKDVAFGPRNLGLPEDEIATRVHEALQSVGLDPDRFGPRSPFTLSGGEMRRVALAGVLAMSPKVLILDEPTAGLDPQGKAEFLQLILRLHAQRQLTVILINHSMDEIAQTTERVIVLDAGRVVMDGPTRQIFARAEELEHLHLGIPQTAQILHRLRARGLPVRTDLFTLEEARAEVLRVLRPA